MNNMIENIKNLMYDVKNSFENDLETEESLTNRE